MSDAKKDIAIVAILKRDNTAIQEERANRIGVELKEAQLSLILQKRTEIRQLENRLAAMTDLSASNNSMDVNSIKDINAAKFVSEYQDLQEKLANKRLLYGIAVKTGEELYGLNIDSL